MVKEINSSPNKPVKKTKKLYFRFLLHILLGGLIAVPVLIIGSLYHFEKSYQQRIYPGVRIDGISFGGKTPDEVEQYYARKSQPFSNLNIILAFEDKIATLSGKELKIAYDGKLSAAQAYSIGRAHHLISDLYLKWKAATSGINLSSVLSMNTNLIDDSLDSLADSIDIAAYDALFKFENGKVTLFRTSSSGRKLNKEQTKKMILAYITSLSKQEIASGEEIVIMLPVEPVIPNITTENSNEYGIRELLSVGTSKFLGSIAGRVHNIELAAGRISGRLVPPNSTFSFNDALGDVSAATGFQPAYIIKDGRTVLGDGGGVCQVSTTLFRAALNAGLPIVERHAHSYRVSYYEQDSSPGLDATVFAPSYDLKFKNDTPNYILIQAKTDRQNYILTFEIYGTSDDRKAEITRPIILSQTTPPDDLYQDDPTLLKGVVKQVDWKAWGAKVTFDYKVNRNGEIIYKQTFFSNFQPWQAVFLRGTRE